MPTQDDPILKQILLGNFLFEPTDIFQINRVGTNIRSRLVTNTNVTLGGSPTSNVNVQVFTSNGTWYPPSGSNIALIFAIGGGGGGGGGGCYVTGNTFVSGGGGGAGAGGIMGAVIPLTTNEYDGNTPFSITVGAGGAGGSGAVSNAISGFTPAFSGTDGGDSSVTFATDNTYFTAYGGKGGQAGFVNKDVSGGAGGLGEFYGGAGGESPVNLSAAVSGPGQSANSFAAGGGGAGGLLGQWDSVLYQFRNGAAGGNGSNNFGLAGAALPQDYVGISQGGSGGIAPTIPGTVPGNNPGTDGSSGDWGGAGGGGGSSAFLSGDTFGGAGGNGSSYGGGGGGGGAASRLSSGIGTGGAGGSGANGIVIIVAF